MSKKKKKKKKSRKMIPALIAILLILIISGSAAGVWLYDKYSYSKEEADLQAYYGLETEEDTAILLNHDFLEQKGILRDGHCYLDMDTVHAYLNDRFYADRNGGAVLYTLPAEVVRAGFGEMVPDGYVAAFEEQGKVWLALDYAKKYSDFNYALYTAPNRVVLETEWTERKTAQLKKDTAIRLRGGVKSEILSKREKGDPLIILKEFEDWDCVQSQDGYIGYLEKRFLENEQTETPVKNTGYVEPDYSGNTREHKINMAWHQVTEEKANSTFPGVVEGVTGLNVISPTWFFLSDNEGGVESIASPEYVQAAHGKGLEVWALVDDFTHEADGVDPNQILPWTEKRAAIIEALMAEAGRCGLDGINVDFEKIKSEAGEDFIQFIRELSVACRARGLVLSVDNYVPRDFNAHYRWKEQGVMADYVIIMGYDEHWGGSQEPGSVASIGYVEEGIQTMTGMVPSHKVINAIPLYTRIWTTFADGTVSSRAVGIQAATDYLLQQGVAYQWDEQTGQNYARFDAEGGFVQVWLEDEQSISGKIGVMKKYDLGGVASWKLTFDDGRENIWSVIAGFLAD